MLVVAVMIVVVRVLIVAVIVVVRPNFVGSGRVGIRIVGMEMCLKRILDNSENSVSLALLGVVMMVTKRSRKLDRQCGKSNPRKPSLSPHVAQKSLPAKLTTDEP